MANLFQVHYTVLNISCYVLILSNFLILKKSLCCYVHVSSKPSAKLVSVQFDCAISIHQTNKSFGYTT